jgi:hypothetical protein
VIHTNKQGEISESTSGAKKGELEELRKQANLIDTWESPYKAIVSVLMLKEGWDPNEPEFWDELDNRLQKYLPHRYNVSDDRSSNRIPRSVVTSSGRESTRVAGGNEFRLSPDRVRAIKEAGRWNNIEERNKMIRKYADYDRANRS